MFSFSSSVSTAHEMKSIHQRSQNRDKEDRAYTCKAPSSGYGAAKWAGRRPREASAATAGEETGRNAGETAVRGGVPRRQRRAAGRAQLGGGRVEPWRRAARWRTPSRPPRLSRRAHRALKEGEADWQLCAALLVVD
jgi:hypothetical protein